MILIFSGFFFFGGEVLKIRWLFCGCDGLFGFVVGFGKIVKWNKWGNLVLGKV